MKKKIAFISSEITPYASTGGLAEVTAALPIALRKLGWTVLQIMPLYRQVRESGLPLRFTGQMLSIPVGFHTLRAEVWVSNDPARSDLVFIARDEFFDRSFLYTVSDRDYDDNFERFVFFQKAVVAYLDTLAEPVDLVHCHDWQTGLMPLYLRYGLKGEGRPWREKTVYTLHNLAFQGVFDGNLFSYSNLPFSCFNVDCLEYYGNVNCMKGGIIAADAITTVSKTYSKEIQTQTFGCGLEGVLAECQNKLQGIVNGIDTEKWNPQKDHHLAHRFSVFNLKGRKTCKQDLIHRSGLNLPDQGPLVGMVSRLTSQKGIPMIHSLIDAWMTRYPDMGWVILGDGPESMAALVYRWERQWPGRIRFFKAFDPILARRIFAGVDMFMMPSEFEPCGLNQFYSMRYGAPPIVHATGGLADTVIDACLHPESGNGFVFKEFTPQALDQTVEKAVEMYRGKRPAWTHVIEQAMRRDSSWTQSAMQYAQLYEKLINRT
ncbi:MAG TPA: glycogen/starch synthase [Kiritimatiellia bacterium]|nr:glycogen/starch synthase [Kiritimatiellia bacterium]